MIPDGARLEAEIAPGVALYDVSRLLPTRGPQKRTQEIIRVYVHHSGALGPAGFKGPQVSTRYVMTQRKPPFPCAAYHYWIPALEVRDPVGRLVLFRLVPDDVVSWHTGGQANQHGVGCVLQGNTSGKPLTLSHTEGLEALLPWLRARHTLDAEWLGWHSIADRFGGKRKASCPGKHAEEWLKEYKQAS